MSAESSGTHCFRSHDRAAPVVSLLANDDKRVRVCTVFFFVVKKTDTTFCSFSICRNKNEQRLQINYPRFPNNYKKENEKRYNKPFFVSLRQLTYSAVRDHKNNRD